VNVTVSAEKQSSSLLAPDYFGLFPAKGAERLLVWASLPPFLLLLSIGVSYLCPCIFTKYLPFLAMGAAYVTIRFKTFGLVGSYFVLSLFFLIFFSHLPNGERLWQMGLLGTLSLSLFILLLSVEEREASLEEIDNQTKELQSLLQKAESAYLFAKKTAEEKEREFQEEIERLKRESELRRIERGQDFKRFGLIESEIEMLTSQKEEFIEDARRAKERAAELVQRFEEQKKTYEAIQSQLKQELMVSQQALLALQHIPVAPALPASLISEEEISELKKRAHQAEGACKQLRSQFEEKALILSQTRQELFQTQSKLMVIEKESALAKLDPNREEVVALEKEITALTREVEGLEKEIIQLEELVFHILSQ
jgi:hypothetical protein